MGHQWQLEAEALRLQAHSSMAEIQGAEGSNSNSNLQGLVKEIKLLLAPPSSQPDDPLSSLYYFKEDQIAEDEVSMIDPASLTSTLRYPNASAAGTGQKLTGGGGVLLTSQRLMKKEMGLQRAAKALEVRAQGIVEAVNHASRVTKVRSVRTSE